MQFMNRMLEDIGATVISRSGRDSFFCSVDTLRSNVETCVRMFSDTVTNPLLDDSEIKEMGVWNMLYR